MAVFIGVVVLGGCATQPQTVSMQTSGGQQEQVAVPKSTWTGAASGVQADALAQEIVEANNNSMKEFDKLQGHLDKEDQRMAKLQSTEDKELQTAQTDGTGKARSPFKRAGHRSDNAILQNRISQTGSGTNTAPHHLPRLPLPLQSWTEGYPAFHRQCICHRDRAGQQEAERCTFGNTPAHHRPVPGEHPAHILQGHRHRRHVCAQGRIEAGREPLPERAYRCSVRYQHATQIKGGIGAEHLSLISEFTASPYRPVPASGLSRMPAQE